MECLLVPNSVAGNYCYRSAYDAQARVASRLDLLTISRSLWMSLLGIRVQLFIVFGLAFALNQAAKAETHIWLPAQQALNSGTATTLPVITVTGKIIWGAGSFDKSISENPNLTGPTSSSLAMAILSSKTRATALANVCTNPSVSPQAKGTTGNSDGDSRWLAAQELFNSVQMAKLWQMYQNAYGGINLIVDGKKYSGFKVVYADGSKETWMVNPGHYSSVVKLFMSPLPDSLEPPGANAQSCVSKR